MDVGVNYPWFDYGWDFGDAPPNVRKDSDPYWAPFIVNELEYLQKIGIQIVRWFLFCDGRSYGSGNQAPHQDKEGKWRFDDPPKLSENFKKHFRTLLEHFSAYQKLTPPIKLLPVLLDYQFCWEGYDALRQKRTTVAEPKQRREWVCCGRSDVVVDTTKRYKFYKNALEPLLDIPKKPKDLSDVIFAWDVFNEPEWVTIGWNPKGVQNLSVHEQQMREFLQGAMDSVRRAGFKATVGFARIETIAKSKLSCDYNQFHHYPGDIRDRKLEPNKFGKPESWIIGEFASSLSRDYWWELSPWQNVFDRLKHAEKMGYPWALPWSVRAIDDHTSWGDAENGIKKFLKKK
jgi:hypothetical protein